MFANTFFKLSAYALVFIVVMIAGIHISKEIFANRYADSFKTLFKT